MKASPWPENDPTIPNPWPDRFPHAVSWRKPDGTVITVLNPHISQAYRAKVRRCMITAANNLLDLGILDPPKPATSHSEEEQQAS